MSRKHTLAIGCLLLAALAAAYAFVSGFSAREDRKREQAEAAGVIPFTDCAELAALSYTSAGTSISFEKDKRWNMEVYGGRRFSRSSGLCPDPCQ
ncbi:hypothetical protein CL3_15830 [butyrate-producing bacterium SM4/1]|nr:hypothetical protein CL3_15830 [butyrate-producing bacterium SM4/1]